MADEDTTSTPWPAVIVQDDVFELTHSLRVVPLTPARSDAPLLRSGQPGAGDPAPRDAQGGAYCVTVRSRAHGTPTVGSTHRSRP